MTYAARVFQQVLLAGFLILALMLPCYAALPFALEQMPVPAGYTLMHGGSRGIDPAAVERYQVLRHDELKYLVLVVEVQRKGNALQRSLLLDDKEPVRLAYTLFQKYVGLDSKMNVIRERKAWILLGDKHYPIRRLRVEFSDTFSEADIYTRLDYPDGKSRLILLGRPATGNRTMCPDFDADFQLMEGALQALVVSQGMLEGVKSPSLYESFFGRILRLPFTPDFKSDACKQRQYKTD